MFLAKAQRSSARLRTNNRSVAAPGLTPEVVERCREAIGSILGRQRLINIDAPARHFIGPKVSVFELRATWKHLLGFGWEEMAFLNAKVNTPGDSALRQHDIFAGRLSGDPDSELNTLQGLRGAFIGVQRTGG